MIADAHEAGARRAMLGRLATDMTVITRAVGHLWPCCWLPYMVDGDTWTWRFCNGNPPGHLQEPVCEHWHHRWEVFLAS